MACLSQPEISRVAELGLATLPGAAEHLASCAACAAACAARVRARRTDAAVAEQLGRYQVLAERGRGAFGSVFEAYDPALDRRVAIKVIASSPRASPGALAELLREAKAMAQIAHPNVIPIFDAGRARDGGVFLTMPIVDGDTLEEWARRERTRGTLDAERVLAGFAVKLAAGLTAIHDAGFVHRDIKPSNVLVAGTNVWVADLGLARRMSRATATQALVDGPLTTSTHTESFGGTPAYMAPECLAGAPASPASDQYALAVSLVEVLTGQRPFAAGTYAELLAAARGGAPDLNDLPRRYHAALARALEPQPERRFPSVTAFADALVAAAPRSRRGRTLALALAAVATVAVAAAWWSTRDPERRTPGAPAPAATPRSASLPVAATAGSATSIDPAPPLPVATTAGSATSIDPAVLVTTGSATSIDPAPIKIAPPPVVTSRSKPAPEPATCVEGCTTAHERERQRCVHDAARCRATAAAAFSRCTDTVDAATCERLIGRYVDDCSGREVTLDPTCRDRARTCTASCATERCDPPPSTNCRAAWMACRELAATKLVRLAEARRTAWAACATGGEACRGGPPGADCAGDLRRCNATVAADYERGKQQADREADACTVTQQTCFAHAAGDAPPADCQRACVAGCERRTYECLATPRATTACATAADARLATCRRRCAP